jgi:tetratricopeptide (TPR) repeat protein
MRTQKVFPCFFLFLAMACASSYEAGAVEKPQIERGFNLLYELKFREARAEFSDWQHTHPQDPLGYVAMSATFLFEEFFRQHVLTSIFFLNDERLLKGIQGTPDEGLKASFQAANQAGRELALKRLDENPHDADALFSLAISTGMQADFALILEGHQLQSLSLIKQAEGYATRLLALKPDNADAWLSLGAANYIIGCLPAYKRFFLWFGRIHGDKYLGMKELQITAEKGHYLKPFAQIFLALAAMRENREDIARTQLQDLVAHFPENPLFRDELAHLRSHGEWSNKGRK